MVTIQPYTTTYKNDDDWGMVNLLLFCYVLPINLSVHPQKCHAFNSELADLGRPLLLAAPSSSLAAQ